MTHYQLELGQRLPFMFEIWKAGAAKPEWQYVLPLNPEVYKLLKTPRINVVKTAEGAYVDNLGPGFDVVILSGTFGYKGVMGGNARTLRQKTDLVGWDLFKELETNILGLYEKYATTDAYGRRVDNPLPADYELHFYNFADEDDFVVEMNRFEITRSIQRKHLYQYDMQMIVKRRVFERGDQQDQVLEMLLNELQEPKDQEMDLWGKLLAGYTSIYSGMSDVINKVHAIRDNLSMIRTAVTAFKNQTSAFIAAPFGLINDTIKTVETLTQTVVSIEGLPHEFIDLLRRTKRTLLSYRLRKEKFRTSATSARTSAASSTEILTASLPGGQIATDNNVVAMNTPETTLFDPSLETVAEVAAYETPVAANDTLEQIAIKTLGSANEWRRIADLNGLEYPYIVKRPLDGFSPILETGILAADLQAGYRTVTISGMTPKPGNLIVMVAQDVVQVLTVESFASGVVTCVLPASISFPAGTVITRHERALAVVKTGDKLKIPGTSTGGTAITDNPSSFFAQLYGADEAIFDGRHIETPTGALQTAEGLENIEMQLAHRLNTRRGELAALGHPAYGSLIPLFIGQLGEDWVYQRIRMEAKSTILQDPRVQSVDSVDFTVEGDGVFIEAVCTLVGQTPSKLRILVN